MKRIRGLSPCDVESWFRIKASHWSAEKFEIPMPTIWRNSPEEVNKRLAETKRAATALKATIVNLRTSALNGTKPLVSADFETENHVLIRSLRMLDGCLKISSPDEKRIYQRHRESFRNFLSAAQTLLSSDRSMAYSEEVADLLLQVLDNVTFIRRAAALSSSSLLR